MTPTDKSAYQPTKRHEGELLLELRSEEIPARMQRRAMADLVALVRDKLDAAGIPAGEIRGHVTPRRLVVIAEGIPAAQSDRSEERRGPRIGAPRQAIDGFLRAAGVASVAQCEVRDTGRGEFYFVVIRRAGRPAVEVLPELLGAAIRELSWPKSMRWPGAALRWVRPLKAILCLYGSAVVPLAIDGVPVGRTTLGHRFLSPGEISAESAADYREKLASAHVVLDQDRRRELIRSELDRRAAELGVQVKPDPGLLDEVTGLAEFPVVLAGAIDRDFMSLPPEVLQTAMRTHQKYFSCVYPDGRPAPHFLFVADNLAPDGGKSIVAGNERVLRARLADARFFWDQDRKVRLEDRVAALKDRVYHAKLGSVYDKVERIKSNAWTIAGQIRVSDPNVPQVGFTHYDQQVRMRAKRAAFLAKADLSTDMVGEFPELQGIMGRYYAKHDGEEDRIAVAIADHYRPLGPNDACPSAPESIVVALADKIDTLVAFFQIGEKPSGSRDPFALRRAALGIIRIIVEGGLRLQLRNTLSYGSSNFDPAMYGLHDPSEEILVFLADRLRVHLRERGVRHDLIAAVFARVISPALTSSIKFEDDLVRLLARVDALSAFLSSEDGINLLTAFRRASNIVSIEERKEKDARYDGTVKPELLVQAEEKALFAKLGMVGPRAGNLLAEERFEQAMAELARLRRPVDEFFDKVTVNTDVPELRENRLRLLGRIRDTMNQVADFSRIEG